MRRVAGLAEAAERDVGVLRHGAPALCTGAPIVTRIRGIGPARVGRPLFAANAALPDFDDPVEQLWQLCTTLREHRGDGHVAALAAAGIDGCQAHQLLIAEQGLPPDLFFDNRGWDDEHQRRSLEILVSRGLIEGTTLTELGADLRDQIEAITDERAAESFNEALDEDDLARLDAVLTPLAEAVQASGVIPFPNPMGLPDL